ncbi:MAG: restriction endonuclease subunit S [Chitinophagaceae bacterium]
MSEWKEVELKSISEYLNRGISPKYSDEGNLIINQKCIRNNVVTINEARFSSVDKKINAEKYLKPLDILVNSTGTGTLGRTAQIKKIGCPISVDTHVTIVRPNNSVDKKFIALQLALKEPEIVALGKGATNQQELGREELGSIKILLPPLPTQQRIASILSAYDDLIENNLKRIKLLEEIAQRTYEEWFVKFRINGVQLEVGENGLPEGWEEKEFQYFGEIITGKTPSTLNEDFFNGEIPFVKTPDMSGFPYVLDTTQTLSELGADNQRKKTIPKNSLMVSCIGSAGVYALASRNCQTNQQINSIAFYQEYYPFYFYCFAKKLKPILEGLGSNGATMTNVNKGKFEKMKAVLPEITTLKNFHENIKLNFETILNLQNQNLLLKESRDILLPRLMSGKVGV